MNVQMALTELKSLQKEVEEGLKNIEDIDYNKEDRDEEFLFAQLMEVVSELKYVSESLDYVSKPVAKTGQIKRKDRKIFLDDIELRNGDSIECLVNDYWERKDVFTVDGDIYVEDLTNAIRAGADQIIGRIRLTEEEMRHR